MKKKLGFIILMSVVSVALIVLGKSIQEHSKAKPEVSNSTVNELATQSPKAQQSNTSDKVNINQTTQEGSGSNTKIPVPDNSKPVVSANSNIKVQVKQTPQPKANITIIDTISGKIIIARATEITGLTVADATCKLLDSANVSYKTSGFGDTIYFSSINGLRERGEGSLSGWCFYVNGKKPNIGAGSYKLNKDDILEWKYLKDGSSN